MSSGATACPRPADAALPMQYPVIATLIWSVVLTAFFAPMAMRSFRRRSRD